MKAEGKAKAKAKTGASRRGVPAPADADVEEHDGAEDEADLPVASTASMKRPARAEPDAVPEETVTEEAEPAENDDDGGEEGSMCLRRPAARRGLKRPAAAAAPKLRAYKYMYHKKEMWGIKLNNSEVMQARR